MVILGFLKNNYPIVGEMIPVFADENGDDPDEPSQVI
jgi:hypothetical protein